MNKKNLNFLFIFLFVTIYIRTPYFQINHPFSLPQAKASIDSTTGGSTSTTDESTSTIDGSTGQTDLLQIERFGLNNQKVQKNGIDIDVYGPTIFPSGDVQRIMKEGGFQEVRFSLEKLPNGRTAIHIKGYWSASAPEGDFVLIHTILVDYDIIGFVRDETVFVCWDSNKTIFVIDIVTAKKLIGHTPIPVFSLGKIPELDSASDGYTVQIIRHTLQDLQDPETIPVTYNKFITPPPPDNVKIIGTSQDKIIQNIDGLTLIDQGSLLIRYTDSTGEETALIIPRVRIDKIMSHGLRYIQLLVSVKNDFANLKNLNALSRKNLEGMYTEDFFNPNFNKEALAILKMLKIVEGSLSIETPTMPETIDQWREKYKKSNQQDNQNQGHKNNKKISSKLLNALKVFKHITPYNLVKSPCNLVKGLCNLVKGHFFTALVWSIIFLWGVMELSSPVMNFRMTTGGNIIYFHSLLSSLISVILLPAIGILGVNAVVRVLSAFSHKTRGEIKGDTLWQATLRVTQKAFAFGVVPFWRYLDNLLMTSEGQKRINYKRHKDESIIRIAKNMGKAIGVLSVYKFEGGIQDTEIRSDGLERYEDYIRYIVDNSDRIEPVLDQYLNPSYRNVDHNTHHLNVEYIQNYLSRRIENDLFKSYNEYRLENQDLNIESFNEWLETKKEELDLRPYFKNGSAQLVHLVNQKREFVRDLMRFSKRNASSLNVLRAVGSFFNYIRHDMNEEARSLLRQGLDKGNVKMIRTIIIQDYLMGSFISAFGGLRSLFSILNSDKGFGAIIANSNFLNTFFNLPAHLQETFQQVFIFMIVMFGNVSMTFNTNVERPLDSQYSDPSHHVSKKTWYSFLRSFINMMVLGGIPRLKKVDGRSQNNFGAIIHFLNLSRFRALQLYVSFAILFRHLLAGQFITQAFAGAWYVLVSGPWLFYWPSNILMTGIKNTQAQVKKNVENLKEVNKKLNAIMKNHFSTEEEARDAFRELFEKILKAITADESPNSIKIVKRFNKTIDGLVHFIQDQNAKLSPEIISYITIEENRNSILGILESLKRPLDKSKSPEIPELSNLKLDDLRTLSETMYTFFNETKNNQPVPSVENKDFESLISLTIAGTLTSILSLYVFANSYQENILTFWNLFYWALFNFTAAYALKELYKAPWLTKQSVVGWLISAFFGTKGLSKLGTKEFPKAKPTVLAVLGSSILGSSSLVANPAINHSASALNDVPGNKCKDTMIPNGDGS